MALTAQGGREARGDVVRHVPAKGGCTVPGRLVAPVAIRVRTGKAIVVVDMAVRAGGHLACWRQLVRIRQPEARGAVIKGRGRPGGGVVTGRAVRNRKYRGRCRVVRVGGLLPSRQMAPGSSASSRLDRQRGVIA